MLFLQLSPDGSSKDDWRRRLYRNRQQVLQPSAICEAKEPLVLVGRTCKLSPFYFVKGVRRFEVQLAWAKTNVPSVPSSPRRRGNRRSRSSIIIKYSYGRRRSFYEPHPGRSGRFATKCNVTDVANPYFRFLDEGSTLAHTPVRVVRRFPSTSRRTRGIVVVIVSNPVGLGYIYHIEWKVDYVHKRRGRLENSWSPPLRQKETDSVVLEIVARRNRFRVHGTHRVWMTSKSIPGSFSAAHSVCILNKQYHLLLRNESVHQNSVS